MVNTTADLPGDTAGAARRPHAGADFWRIELARGIWCALVGVATVFWQRESTEALGPAVPVDTVEYLIGAYLIVLGGIQFTMLRSRQVTGLLRQTALAHASVNGMFGLIALVCGLTAAGIAEFHWVVFAWAAIHAAGDIAFALQLRRRVAGRQDWLLSGGLHGVLALVLLIFVHLEPLTVMGLVGAAAVMSGILLILGGVTARRSARRR